MNEAETRAELIDPKLKENGWDAKLNAEVKVHREFPIAPGKIQTGGKRKNPLWADYVLAYKGRKLAVVEAKSDECVVGEGVQQAKEYADKLNIEHAYSANGNEIYHINMDTAAEASVDNFHSPDELWNITFPVKNEWQNKFSVLPYEDVGGSKGARFYQETAVDKTMDAIAEKKNRILLTLATGTGKTFIAFQIAWKLFQTRWNTSYEASRRPRILFLADRNILANQAFNAFSAFPEDALVRISPKEIRKTGKVPTNGSIFFTIFQTFMSGGSTSSPTADEDERIDFKEVLITEIIESYGYMYILQCGDGSFYTGSTKNLQVRLKQHKNGEGSEFTRTHLPLKLVYYETFDRIDLAFKREKQIQKWSRAKKIALIQGDIEKLKELSKNRQNEPKVGEPAEPKTAQYNFGQYPSDYFDFIIIDECHRGGANDESNWRGILEYFSPAVQIGLTATPKRNENVDTYKYFGEPVYTYSLKDGINDGFLTPFKVKRVKTSLDEYTYTPDDNIVEGEIEAGKTYKEADFNKIIEIK